MVIKVALYANVVSTKPPSKDTRFLRNSQEKGKMRHYPLRDFVPLSQANVLAVSD